MYVFSLTVICFFVLYVQYVLCMYVCMYVSLKKRTCSQWVFPVKKKKVSMNEIIMWMKKVEEPCNSGLELSANLPQLSC